MTNTSTCANKKNKEKTYICLVICQHFVPANVQMCNSLFSILCQQMCWTRLATRHKKKPTAKRNIKLSTLSGYTHATTNIGTQHTDPQRKKPIDAVPFLFPQIYGFLPSRSHPFVFYCCDFIDSYYGSSRQRQRSRNGRTRYTHDSTKLFQFWYQQTR